MATARPPRIAVALATYNHAHFLRDALDSVLSQTRRPNEIIVVDDGSSDDPAAIVVDYPGVRMIRQVNQGLAAARNTAMAAAASEHILFLDADDVLAPEALEAAEACFADNPESGFVYGAHLRVDAHLRPKSAVRYAPIGARPHLDFLQGNYVGMHATVLYDRAKLTAAGGFDVTLRKCEDYDAYLRMSRSFPVSSHSTLSALYRIHDDNMSTNSRDMLGWVQSVRRREVARGLVGDQLAAWRRGGRIWKDYYAREVFAAARSESDRGARLVGMTRAVSMSPTTFLYTAPRRLAGKLPASIRYLLKRSLGRAVSPPVGRVSLGDLGTTRPISADFGWDRGTPVDRYYIENFLKLCASDIVGDVLEIGETLYSRKFGTGITRQHVLHVHAGNPEATIVGDLSVAGVLPPSAFDCIILTQTLHLIYDMRAAIVHLHEALKPGGVLLMTTPGISQIDRGEWGDGWMWSLTAASATRLAAEAFEPKRTEVAAFGNVYAATTYLQGLALSEVDAKKLDVVDKAYPVIVTVRASRATVG